MTDNLYADAREQSLEIKILRADLAGTKAEWFKQQREWVEREQDYARKLAVAELRADAFRDAVEKMLPDYERDDYGSDAVATKAGDLLDRAPEEWAALALAKEGL